MQIFILALLLIILVLAFTQEELVKRVEAEVRKELGRDNIVIVTRSAMQFKKFNGYDIEKVMVDEERRKVSVQIPQSNGQTVQLNAAYSKASIFQHQDSALILGIN